MIRLGIVGYGYWGPNLARNAAEAEGGELAAIADFSAPALVRAKKRHPGAQLHEHWRTMIADPTIDAVLVATPVASHFEIALAALKAGKHVLIEKPMTATSAEAQILIQEATRRNLVLMVDHTFVYTRAVRKIRDLISDGSLGDVYYYDFDARESRAFPARRQRDLGSRRPRSVDHRLSDGRAAGCRLRKRRRPYSGQPENIARIMLFYPERRGSQLNVNWLAPVKVRQTLIGGSRKMIVYDDLEPSEKVKVYDKGVTSRDNPEEVHNLRVGYRIGDMWAPQLSVREALLTEIEHFIDCID